MGSSQTRARTRVPCTGRQILNHCATREVPTMLLLNSVSWGWLINVLCSIGLEIRYMFSFIGSIATVYCKLLPVDLCFTIYPTECETSEELAKYINIVHCIRKCVSNHFMPTHTDLQCSYWYIFPFNPSPLLLTEGPWSPHNWTTQIGDRKKRHKSYSVLCKYIISTEAGQRMLQYWNTNKTKLFFLIF